MWIRGYLAPEYIVHGHLTEKADVYSFGMLIFEIVSGKRCSNPLGLQAGHSLLAKVIYFSVSMTGCNEFHVYLWSTHHEIME